MTQCPPQASAQTASTDPSLSVFTPSRTPPEQLEAIHVQRHALLSDAVQRVIESATTNNTHHQLFVGPRGTGKTHFTTLMVHRVSKAPEHETKLHIAWLNEDETSTSVLELLQRIAFALVKRYPDLYSKTALDAIYDMAPEQAQIWLIGHLLSILETRTLLVLVENLDQLFTGLGKAGQHELRALLQEHPQVALVATAQRLAPDLKDRKAAFFGFFQTEYLKPLDISDATKLLANIAELKQQTDVSVFLNSPTGHARVRALHHLAGGNHRIFIVLSQFITRDNIDALVVPFDKMVDEMTPYYQERIRWLPPQQRKIVEFLCGRERPTPVKDIARRLFSTNQIVSSQLKDLRNKGYVIAGKRGRESLYEIAEPMMRICVEVKENQSHEPLRVLVDFLRVWYDQEDLNQRLTSCTPGELSHQYLQAALHRNEQDGPLRTQLLINTYRSEQTEMDPDWDEQMQSYASIDDSLAIAYGEWTKNNNETEAQARLDQVFSDKSRNNSTVRAYAYWMKSQIADNAGDQQEALNNLDKLLAHNDLPDEFRVKAPFNRAVLFLNLGYPSQALEDLQQILELPDLSPTQLSNTLITKALAHHQLHDWDSAIVDNSAVIELDSAPTRILQQALINRGSAYAKSGQLESAIKDYSHSISMDDSLRKQSIFALTDRGNAYTELHQYQEALADFSQVIKHEKTTEETKVRALIGRGLCYKNMADFSSAVADFAMAAELSESNSIDQASAYINLGSAFNQLNEPKKAIDALASVTTMNGLNSPLKVVAQFELAKTHADENHWEEAISALTKGLSADQGSVLTEFLRPNGLIASLFQGAFSNSERTKRVNELVATYEKFDASTILHETLIQHVGLLAQQPVSPSTATLDDWFDTWKQALSYQTDAKLPLRLLRTGIDYLKSEKSAGVLAELNQEERAILEQAFEPSNKPNQLTL